MKIKVIFLLVVLFVTVKTNHAQIANFPAGTLKPNSFSACNNPIIMEYGTSASNFSIGDPISFYIDFGDGTNYTAPVQFITNVINDSLFGTISHTYLNAGTYTPTLTVSGPGALPLAVSWWWGQNTLTVGPPLPCGNLTGNVFNDINANCVMDIGEELANEYVAVYLAGNFLAIGETDFSGNYSIDYPFSLGQTYIVTYIPNINPISCIGVTCPITQTYAVNVLNSTNNNFGLAMTNANYDMLASWNSISGGGILNAGFNRIFYFGYQNYHCPIIGGTYSITLDPSVNYLSATPAPSVVVGNTLTWNVATIPLAQILEVNTFIPLANVNNVPFIIGDSVCHTSVITGAVAGDWNLLNNTNSECYYIGTSYDPNDKHVAPKGVGVNGNVNFGTEFSYGIRFQNTGNSPAINVVVLDTLDSNLDPSTVVVSGRSHYMLFTQTGNVLKFEFPNIMLPDSNTNYDASQGGVSFKVKHKSGLAQNTSINNNAHIYFDLNAAIVTNSTINTLTNGASGFDNSFSANGIQVYPNPFYDMFKVSLSDVNSKIISCEIQNQIGEQLQKISPSSTSLNLSLVNFSAGIYFIKIIDNKGNIYQKKLIKQ